MADILTQLQTCLDQVRIYESPLSFQSQTVQRIDQSSSQHNSTPQSVT
jgi:hypothetical protein